MPGICTSEITHDVSFTHGDWRKSTADANVQTVNPSERTRLCVATRMDASSSMIEITGCLGKTVYPSRESIGIENPLLQCAPNLDDLGDRSSERVRVVDRCRGWYLFTAPGRAYLILWWLALHCWDQRGEPRQSRRYWNCRKNAPNSAIAAMSFPAGWTMSFPAG
jgi:hypothetical protein